jgi:hypothetical protein
MPIFDFQEREADEDLRAEAIAERRRNRRLFAWCSECLSNGHRAGCPEASEPRDEEDDEESDVL